jgi:4-hydroxy-4-methyl-2-oxoglutarate aldolase
MGHREHDAATTIRREFERVDEPTVAAARTLPSATLHEAAGKIGALPSAIKPVAPSFTCCGPALTVHSPPGDNLWLHRALDMARPGDVLVVHVSGAHDYGYWGEIMTTMAKARRLGGLVIDGCVRDGVLLERIGFPVFARGLCIRGTGKDYGAIGWLNEPVRLGDVTVAAGDLVVGDADGVVVLPRDRAAMLVAKAQQRERDEAAILERLQAGESTMQVYNFH